jgi:hypothetical protein
MLVYGLAFHQDIFVFCSLNGSAEDLYYYPIGCFDIVDSSLSKHWIFLPAALIAGGTICEQPIPFVGWDQIGSNVDCLLEIREAGSHAYEEFRKFTALLEAESIID